MSNFNTIAEIEAVFGALRLSPIEEGMKDIQTAKQSFDSPSNNTGRYHRVILTNGTGTLINNNEETYKNAELERRLSRAAGA
jgi:hypothetical protein